MAPGEDAGGRVASMGRSSTQVQEARGLCRNCLHVAACAFRLSRPDVPIVYCEEYAVSCPDRKPSARSADRVQGEPRRNGSRMGLCVNCDHREACSRVRPLEGVWHCEEYR